MILTSELISDQDLLLVIQEALNELVSRKTRPMVRYGSILTDHGHVSINPKTELWEAKMKVIQE